MAADFCQHYDSRYGNSLNGPSRAKIMDIVRFMSTYEAFEEEGVDPYFSSPLATRSA